MKAIISISIVILIFFGFAIWTQTALNSTAQDIADRLSVIEEAVFNEDWHIATKEMALVHTEW